MSNFNDVVPSLAKALTERGYAELTPVQKAVLKPEIRDSDLLVSAQTGSGKTVAFGMAIAPTLLGETDHLSKASTPLALIVAPTRELALQVKRELDWLYADTGAVIASCVGGMDIRTERRALQRGAHIVVGTPGRLRDHIMRNALDTTQLRAAILDEADEMLDLGFREDLEFILEATPEERRTLLFSATVPAPIAKLAKLYQNDAIRISTQEEKQQHGDIEYRALVVAPRERENAIVNVLRYYEAENALVFCNTRAAVNHMVARFNNRGFSVVALSGELSQNERTHALQAMRDGRARVCIATDVAARGIDLPKLELVIHADLPSDPETLLHRSGRTGRAGRKGVSALMVDQKGRNRAERLLRAAKISASWANPPSADAVIERDEERMLADPILTDEVHGEEIDATARMLAKFSPEQIAAAFLRLSKAGKSAPEDIQAVSVSAPSRREFGDSKTSGKRKTGKSAREFDQSLWVTISVGRKQNAEPRWLIPLICNAGNLSKPDIGYIKIEQNQTHVELDATQADRFLESIGPNLTLEKNVRVDVLDGKPDFDSSARFGKPRKSGEKRSSKPHRGKGKTYTETDDGTSKSEKGKKRKFKPKAASASKKPKAAPEVSKPKKKRKKPKVRT
ncbi:MAG: DEAD/DEAH box helicase [Rhizobiaceae bacterium]|nr:DEAD/DEAH box helicase [Rhizobiaceae bacterium]